MRILRNILSVSCLVLCIQTSLAQKQKIEIQEDPAFQNILSEKRRLNSAITVTDRFKIQVYYGNNADARSKLADFKAHYPNIDGTVVYTNPSYKVWVGNFKTRIEAERYLQSIKSRFSNAMIIRPNK